MIIGLRTGKIIVFSAASGAGKTTLLNYLKETIPELVYSISVTTRNPRPHEKDGLHYFFVTKGEFECRIQDNAFAEWAVVHGHYYGTPRRFIDDTIASGKHVIMDIDVFGKKKFDALYPAAVGILLLPPSIEALRKRLELRGTDSADVINLRITNAEKEIAFAREQGKYEYTVINDRLEKAQTDVLAIVEKETMSSR